MPVEEDMMVDLTVDVKREKEPLKWSIIDELESRCKDDPFLAEACKKQNKTLDGVIKYVTQEARKQAVKNCAVIEDEEVYEWAVHYILEDSIDCENTKKLVADCNKLVNESKWSVTKPVTPVVKVGANPQLLFDF